MSTWKVWTEPKRSTLAQLRRDILAVVPEAEQCISYAVPGFKVAGKTIAGFAAFKNHLSYLPHSGSVFPELRPGAGGVPEILGRVAVPRRPAPAARTGGKAYRRAATPGGRGELMTPLLRYVDAVTVPVPDLTTGAPRPWRARRGRARRRTDRSTGRCGVPVRQPSRAAGSTRGTYDTDEAGTVEGVS